MFAWGTWEKDANAIDNVHPLFPCLPSTPCGTWIVGRNWIALFFHRWPLGLSRSTTVGPFTKYFKVGNTAHQDLNKIPAVLRGMYGRSARCIAGTRALNDRRIRPASGLKRTRKQMHQVLPCVHHSRGSKLLVSYTAKMQPRLRRLIRAEERIPLQHRTGVFGSFTRHCSLSV